MIQNRVLNSLLLGAAPWLVWQGLALVAPLPELNSIFLILLGIILILWRFRWLEEMGFPHSFVLSFNIVGSLVVMLALMQAIVTPMLTAEELASEPCGPKTIEALCYNMPHDACASTWTQYKNECRKDIESRPENNKVGALLGHQIKHCAEKKFDHSFKATRRLMSSADCYQYFNSLDQ
jgi:hypothetical protein